MSTDSNSGGSGTAEAVALGGYESTMTRTA
jgi:hypothetical protein